MHTKKRARAHTHTHTHTHTHGDINIVECHMQPPQCTTHTANNTLLPLLPGLLAGERAAKYVQVDSGADVKAGTTETAAHQ